MAIEENDAPNESISVYPNPAHETVTVEGLDCYNIKIYNAIGQLVRTSKGNKVFVSGLSQGLYLLRMTDDKGRVECKKIVVK